MNAFRMMLATSSLIIAVAVAPRAGAQEELVELVSGLLSDPDKEVRALAFDQIRQAAKGEAMTLRFAELLPMLPPDTQVGLLSALADRRDSAAAPAVRQLLSNTADQSVRVAAIKALGALGGSDDLKLFLQSLSDTSEPVRQAARASLIGLPEQATSAIMAGLNEAPTQTRIALIEVLVARRAHDAVPALLDAAADADLTVRQSAISALAQLADIDDVPRLISLVLKAGPGPDRDAAERMVARVCQRSADRETQAEPVLAAMKELSEKERTELFSTLGRIGGNSALKVIDDALESSRPELRGAGIRALCNWPDGAVVSRLLEVARADELATQRKLAFKALIRIAPIADQREDRRRLDAVRTVFAMCSTDADRRLVLDRAKAIRSIDTLRFVVSFLDQPALAQQACRTVVELAHHSSLRESNKEEFHRRLDEVMTISDDVTVIERARRYKAGQTWKPSDASR